MTDMKGIIVPWNHSPPSIDLHRVGVILSVMTPIFHSTSRTMVPYEFYSYLAGIRLVVWEDPHTSRSFF